MKIQGLREEEVRKQRDLFGSNVIPLGEKATFWRKQSQIVKSDQFLILNRKTLLLTVSIKVNSKLILIQSQIRTTPRAENFHSYQRSDIDQRNASKHDHKSDVKLQNHSNHASCNR